MITQVILSCFILLTVLDVSQAVYPANIRIIGSADRGRVEVFYNNVRGTICSDYWDDSSAVVICHSLGFERGVALGGKETVDGYGNIWLDDVKCIGTETTIDECPHLPWGVNDCTHEGDAGVQCFQPFQSDIRLADGNNTSGQVQVDFLNEWGTICDDSWGSEEARVICRMLGYSDGLAIPSQISAYVGRIWLDKVDCNGQELSLTECSHYPWGTVTCKHGQEARVQCLHHYSVDARIIGVNAIGRAEVKYNNIWGTICSNNWDDNAALVFCRMNGFLNGYAKNGPSVKPGKGEIWLSDVRCNGSEISIGECDHAHWGLNECTHEEDAGVRCMQESPVTVRLTKGWFGRVEVNYFNEWGSICDNYWNNNAAAVVCRMLGYRKGNTLERSKRKNGSGRIWLDQVLCTGVESNIKNCIHRSWGSHDCTHTQDAAVECHEPIYQNIRIVGGDTSKGRVEIYHNNIWGTICDDYWNDKAAIIVCKSLGFRTGKALVGKYTPHGSGQRWLDDVKCSGNEKSLKDCNHKKWGVTDCTHDEDAGVECFNRI